jgi:hypothetical protein
MLKEGQQYRSRGFPWEMYIQIKSFHEDGAFFYILRILSIDDVTPARTRTFRYPHRDISNIEGNHRPNPMYFLFSFFSVCISL